MKNSLFFSGVLLLMASANYGQEVIFLHHSTGNGVYKEGKVATWINNYNTSNGTDYHVTEMSYPNDPYDWANYPYDYWNLWLNNACDNTEPNIACLNSICASYNVIIFKHCFPGAAIEADGANPSVASEVKTLANYKLQYRALRELMDSYPDNKFIVWTLAPLHRLSTNVESAARANEFVDWVKNDWLSEDGNSHPNIYVFDFYGYVAEFNTNPENGNVYCLKYDYEQSHTENDSHPNTLANQTVGPLFAQFIVNTIEDGMDVMVESIAVTGADGASSINTIGGTLQLSADIMPEDASNKTVTWSIQNGTGEASVDENGLVTALANGTVTATAAANDGSGISGNLAITIETQMTVLVSDISVFGENGNTSINIPGGTLQLTAEIIPADASNKTVTWSIQNGTGEATVDENGLVTAISDGTVTVTATARDGSGISGNLEISIENQTIPTSLNNSLNSAVLTVNHSMLNISLKKDPMNTTIYLYNAMGCLLFSSKIIRTQTDIDLSGMDAGVYFLVLSDRNENYQTKLFIP